MKSTIRVEMDFNIKEPILQITLDKDSTELADQTLKYFVECANSNGMEIRWPSNQNHSVNVKPQIRVKRQEEPVVSSAEFEIRAIGDRIVRNYASSGRLRVELEDMIDKIQKEMDKVPEDEQAYKVKM